MIDDLRQRSGEHDQFALAREDSVNHRSIPILDQGTQRPSCSTIFATVALHLVYDNSALGWSRVRNLLLRGRRRTVYVCLDDFVTGKDSEPGSVTATYSSALC